MLSPSLISNDFTVLSPLKRTLHQVEHEMKETPPCKRQYKDTIVEELQAMRLPNPCPLPTAFSPAVNLSIIQNEIIGNCKIKMMRESAAFFYGICPYPNPSEYLEMAKALCNKYPVLQDIHCTDGAYWVY